MKTTGNLTKEQKKFIEKTVLSLGSITNVDKYYKWKDLVSEFAKEFARKKFKVRHLKFD